MYRNCVLNLSKQLQQLFTSNTELHDCNTRNRNNPLVPLHKLAVGQNSIAHIGPRIWTAIQKEAKNSVSINVLNISLKRYYLIYMHCSIRFVLA